jgi:hypothetical protein
MKCPNCTGCVRRWHREIIYLVFGQKSSHDCPFNVCEVGLYIATKPFEMPPARELSDTCLIRRDSACFSSHETQTLRVFQKCGSQCFTFSHAQTDADVLKNFFLLRRQIDFYDLSSHYTTSFIDYLFFNNPSIRTTSHKAIANAKF